LPRAAQSFVALVREHRKAPVSVEQEVAQPVEARH
jgi:hypothetical protein